MGFSQAMISRGEAKEMSSMAGFRTRTAVKQEFILSRLRRQIVEGEFPPGSQLPTRQVLGQRFGVSSATLQRALDQLIHDGFIYARGSMGTFVSQRLPFTKNYGLVFPASDIPAHPWTRFWVALKNEAEKISQSGDSSGYSMPIYLGIEGRADADEYRRLVKHIRDQRLAGLIFISPVKSYRGTPLLDAPNLPRVAIASESSDNVPTLRLHGMYEKAMDRFRDLGCKKLALVTSSSAAATGELQVRWAEGVAARGMAVRSYWMQVLDVSYPQAARNLVQLLMRGPEEDRPDGLFIGDDNLVEYATAGLIDSGVKVPAETKVIAHCNFPWPTPSVLPIERLGYDVRECLRNCVDAIDKQRNKEFLAPIIVPARFESEVRSSQ